LLLKTVLLRMLAAKRTPGIVPLQDSRSQTEVLAQGARRVLNVGGHSKTISIPRHFEGWDHVLLDIDPSAGPDIVCDARKLRQLEPEQFDAVYCSHNLEHYHKHDGAQVLRGFVHVLKSDGFAQLRVPDLRSVMRKFVADEMDLEDVLYVSPAGPITVRDVIYGWGKKIEQSGEDFFAHKTGFTATTLRAELENAGFSRIVTIEDGKRFEIAALAFKCEPTQFQSELLNLSRPKADREPQEVTGPSASPH
jgi:predicted SAM-dependent methyltransferase